MKIGERFEIIDRMRLSLNLIKIFVNAMITPILSHCIHLRLASVAVG
jgi:hypothetical protein